ncbi:MAG: hypothetical protein ACPGO3_00445 [Magnetospiraceae bacterium]
MGKAILALPDWLQADPDFATIAYSGGSWVLPASNVGDPFLATIARSTDLDPASTQMDIDLGRRRSVKVVAIPDHTISRAGKIRLRAATDAAFTDVLDDTGWVDVWPIVDPWDTREWLSDTFWDGKITDEEAATYKIGWVHVTAQTIYPQFLRLEIDDQTNPAGVIDLARLIAAPGWQVGAGPGEGVSWPVDFGIEDNSPKQVSLGNVQYSEKRPIRRRVRFTADFLREDETFAKAFEALRRMGETDSLYFVFDPDDAIHGHRRSFLATLARLGDVRMTRGRYGQVRIELLETL